MNLQKTITKCPLFLLAWCLLSCTPMFAQTIITHVPQFSFPDAALRGGAVSGAGDVNGDGFDDVIVGNVGANGAGGIGIAQVFSGTDGSLLHQFDGGPFFGIDVSEAGDVNGDGFDDLIVAGRGDDGVRVCSGFNGEVLYNFATVFDSSVGSAGDVNGDGFDDLIVGDPGAMGGGFFNGVVRVHSGFDGSVIYEFSGDFFDDQLGNSVRGAGDVNGDGTPDLIAGGANANYGLGIARVFSGVDGSVLYTFEGDSLNLSFGQEVDGAGDVNGDGFDDLIVGGESFTAPVGGRIWVFSGADGSVLYDIEGDGPDFGGSVSGAGDVNGDGFADLIVGQRGASNNGSLSGTAHVFSGFDGSSLYTFNGSNSNELLGTGVSDAGDVNADGVPDLVVSAPRTINEFGATIVFVSQVTFLGDVNLDGIVNFLDISAFIAVLSSGEFQIEADCNQDGVVNFLDITPFIEILSNQ